MVGEYGGAPPTLDDDSVSGGGNGLSGGAGLELRGVVCDWPHGPDAGFPPVWPAGSVTGSASPNVATAPLREVGVVVGEAVVWNNGRRNKWSLVALAPGAGSDFYKKEEGAVSGRIIHRCLCT